MTGFVEAVAPTTTVATAARLMVEHHLRWMPVCDEAGRVLGVIYRSDVLAVFLRDDASIRAELADEVLGADAHGVQVDVRDGVVTLAGEVATPLDAERLVRGQRTRRRRRRGRGPPHLPAGRTGRRLRPLEWWRSTRGRLCGLGGG